MHQESKELAPGQRPFERASQLRATEKAIIFERCDENFFFGFSELPSCAQMYLEAASLGAEFWTPDRRVGWGYESPLNAICVISGTAGGMLPPV